MVELTVESGAQAVWRWAQATPQAIAVESGAGRLSYAGLARQLANAVKALEAGGVRAGMVVGLECGVPDLGLLLALACEVLGAITLPLAVADLRTASPVARRCELIVTEQVGAQLALDAPAVLIDAALVGGLSAPASAEDLARLRTCHGLDAGVRIARTSGTTGAAKFILKTRRMLSAAIDAYDVALRPVAGPYTYVCFYSPAINGVYTDLVRALRFGNRIRFVFALEDFVRLAEPANCYAYLLPKEAEKLAAMCREAGTDLRMRYVDVTGAGVSPELAAALKASVTSWVGNVYSSNETSVIARWEAENRYAVTPGVEVRIVGEDGRTLPPGETGRICVRSAFVASGYLWDEAQTVQHFRDGWFLTSDLGCCPEPGRLVVLGRLDDMLNIGGVKVPPYPIEQALRSVPGVSEAVLLRIESQVAVGVICAVIEPLSGQEQSALVQRVAAVMKQHVGAFMITVDAKLPRTETGKVRRDALKAHAEAARAELLRRSPRAAVGV